MRASKQKTKSFQDVFFGPPLEGTAHIWLGLPPSVNLPKKILTGVPSGTQFM